MLVALTIIVCVQKILLKEKMLMSNQSINYPPYNYAGNAGIGKKAYQGRGCGKVGRAVPSDSRDPRFKSQHRQLYILNMYLLIAIQEKTKIKKKRPGMAH